MNNRGLTLIELIISIAILSIISCVALNCTLQYRKKTNVQACYASRTTIAVYVKELYIFNGDATVNDIADILDKLNIEYNILDNSTISYKDEYTFTDSDNCVIIDLKERTIKCNEHTLSDNYIAHF